MPLLNPGEPIGQVGPDGTLPMVSVIFPLDPYPALMLLCAILSLFLCTRIWYGTKKSLARGVALYLGAVFLLSLFKFAEFVFASSDAKFGALKMQWLGVAFLPCSFFIIAMAFRNKPLKGLASAAAFLPGIVAVALVWTNQLHLLFWRGDLRFLPPFERERAPGYWIFSAYALVQIGAAFAIMIAAVLRARGLTRRWMRRLIGILLLPTASNVVYVLFGGSDPMSDPTPVIFALSGLLMAWTLKGFDIFEAIPYAKTVLLESIDSPIVVVDSEGLVIGANEESGRISPDGKPLEGKSIAEIVPDLSGGMEVGGKIIWPNRGIDYLVSCYETKRTRSHWKSRIFLFRDITDLVKTRRDLEKARLRAEEANAAKSAFIATVSHEIRNPLNSIIGLVDLNLQGSSLPRELREDLEVVQSSGNVILGLVNDLLDLSKIEAGRMELEAADFDLQEKVVSVVRAFRPAAEKKGISLDVDIEDGTPRYVCGDALRFGQILMNLVSNAIKFTKDGAVSVTIAPLEGADPRDEGDGRSLCVSAVVRDTGIGITPEGLPLLFREFSQADSSISRRFGGTGLGLSICKRLVDLFGGKIEVASTPGEGSVFSFTARFAPATALEAAAVPAVPAAPVGAEGFRVLVVEDDLVNAAVARRYLERLGYQTLIARTGAEAVALVAREAPGLVLLDLGLPDMDGFEACRRMRETAAQRSGETIIAAMTARVDAGIRADCASAGMYDCLSKPVDPIGLEKLLDRATAKLRELGPRAASTVRASGVSAAVEEACPESAPPEAPLIDAPALLERVDGDRSFVRELLGILVSEAPEKRAALDASLLGRDLEALRKLAHRVKGAALTLCALPLVAAAAKLESACIESARQDLSQSDPTSCGQIDALVAELEDCYGQTVAEADRYLRSSAD
jgi:signal transduction histidine kinase/CheY-like chemotaxis protein/HPt (histidine-containing phosphotransfer) domain-containing protein